MITPRPWRDVLASISSAIDADPVASELGVTLAAAWTATIATPAILCVPVRRIVVKPTDVRWELALQVVVPLQSDDDEPFHSLLELALDALPPGCIPGETTYGQDDRAGASYVVSTTIVSV